MRLGEPVSLSLAPGQGRSKELTAGALCFLGSTFASSLFTVRQGLVRIRLGLGSNRYSPASRMADRSKDRRDFGKVRDHIMIIKASGHFFILSRQSRVSLLTLPGKEGKGSSIRSLGKESPRKK